MSQTETNQTTSTGPRTEEGKAASSRNALKSGLFTEHDFVLPDERHEHFQTWTILMDELAPEGLLELAFADEIVSAHWRLRRCRLVEANLAIKSLEGPEFDDDKLDRRQRSIDRARAAAHTILRRSMTELRRLQTERQIRSQLGATESLGLADTKQIIRTLDLASVEDDGKAEEPTPAPGKRITLADLENLMALSDKKLCADIRTENPSSFCTQNQSASQQPAAAPKPGLQTALQALRDARNKAA